MYPQPLFYNQETLQRRRDRLTKNSNRPEIETQWNSLPHTNLCCMRVCVRVCVCLCVSAWVSVRAGYGFAMLVYLHSTLHGGAWWEKEVNRGKPEIAALENLRQVRFKLWRKSGKEEMFERYLVHWDDHLVVGVTFNRSDLEVKRNWKSIFWTANANPLWVWVSGADRAALIHSSHGTETSQTISAI